MSRVIVKNLPKYIKKERLNQLFSVYGTITDTKMIYSQGDVFRRIAFIGFSNEDEAHNAISKMNQTYIDTCKVGVELAKSMNDETLERPWSRYSKQSSAYVQSEKDKIERVKIIDAFKNKDATLKTRLSSQKKNSTIISASQNKDSKIKQNSKQEKIILETCGIDAEDEEKFKEYMMLNNAKPISIQDDVIIDEENSLQMDANESEQINTKDDNVCYTAKLSNLRPNVKFERLLKFFKDLDVLDIRVLPLGERKKTCIAYADFANENDLKKAVKMSGKPLKGNTIKIIESNKKKVDTKPRYIASDNIDENEQTLLDTGRIFISNLPFICETAEVQQLFEKYGPVVDINMPTNKDTAKPIGYAFITFMLPENAIAAFNELNSVIFKGRLLHLIPAKSDDIDDFINASSANSYKLKKMKKLKQITANMIYTWNTLFINQNTVANILSKRLDISKDQLLLDPSFASNPAVSIAAGETALVNETKHFLESNGVNLDSFGQGNDEKSDCILLAKNLPENVTSAQLMEFILSKMNSNDESKVLVKPRIIIPPYGVTAIIKFEDSTIAKHAFKKLAFTRFRFTPLYLEWAPKETMTLKHTSINTQESNINNTQDSSNVTKIIPISGCVVFIKNLNPITTEETIRNFVEDIAEAVNITLARKNALKDTNESLGYGFIEFGNANDAKECVKKLQGCVIDENSVELKLSDRTIIPKSSDVVGSSKTATAEEGEVPKILVKNIPFEATRNDIMELFKTYGNVKHVRLPQKVSTVTSSLRNQHRGFAFVEFLTLEDAKHCFECLRYSTHLYGRRLVLEWANDSTSISNIRKRTAAHFTQDNVTGKDVTSGITETLENM